MAKGEQKSNKEKKKPKQEKPKDAAPISPFAKGQGGAAKSPKK
jgi:hypothetical protein